MIKQRYINQLQRRSELEGQQAVLLGRFSASARVIVSDDQCAGVVEQRLLRDFPRMDKGQAQRSSEQFLAGNDAVSRIEIKTAEDLMLQSSETYGKVIADQLEASKLGAVRHVPCKDFQRGVNDASVVGSAVAAVHLPI